MSEFFHYAKFHEQYFLKHGQECTFKKGNQIVRPGEPNKWVYFLSDGLVKISFCLSDGTERILGYFIPGMVFAQSGSFYNQPDHGLEYVATTNILAYRIPNTEFIEQLKTSTDFAIDYIDRLSLNQMYQIDRIVYQGEKGIYAKCINWLLFMIKYYGKTEGDGAIIEVPLTQEIAANFMHATRESASAALGRLKKKGLLSTKKKYFMITSVSKLRQELN